MSYIPRSSEDRSSRMFFIQVVNQIKSKLCATAPARLKRLCKSTKAEFESLTSPLTPWSRRRRRRCPVYTAGRLDKLAPAVVLIETLYLQPSNTPPHTVCHRPTGRAPSPGTRTSPNSDPPSSRDSVTLAADHSARFQCRMRRENNGVLAFLFFLPQD